MTSLFKHFSLLFHEPVGHSNFLPVSGGSINQTFQLKLTNNKRVFCKINSASKFPHLFEREKEGLALIQKPEVIRTPKISAHFVAEEQQVLLMEWIDEGPKNAGFWKKFGEQLAALHKITNDYFGLGQDNFMGSVTQFNTPSKDWVNFFTECRLKPLLQQCLAANLLTAKHVVLFEGIFVRLPDLFTEEKPALLHGDIWSGNFMCNQHSEPVLIDPAVYFGHRSMDLAMTTLFGGFDKGFYEAYHYYFPVPPNYKEQWEVCNLYPLLIHLLLFGRSYLNGIETTLKKYQ